MAADASDGKSLKTTPLNALHRELGAKMVPFAGYDMPVQFRGIIAEHEHTRTAASLFDVSHMGQIRIDGGEAARALERLVPADVSGLPSGRMRYSLFTNEDGGILDDLMISQMGDHLFLVVNAARKAHDFDHLRRHLADDARVEMLDGRALLALQGPKAAEVLGRHARQAGDLAFMQIAPMRLLEAECIVSRSGYTGEDGFEISVPEDRAEEIARALLDAGEVAPAGLGARDSLRLEAGLCLYGHDIDETTTPVEARLAWVIDKRRRAEGGFPGAEKILAQLSEGPARKRVGILPEGRAPAREGTTLTDAEEREIGVITSGGFGPSVGGPVAMGYVESRYAEAGTELQAMVRGKPRPAKVAKLPFVPSRAARPKN